MLVANQLRSVFYVASVGAVLGCAAPLPELPLPGDLVPKVAAPSVSTPAAENRENLTSSMEPRDVVAPVAVAAPVAPVAPVAVAAPVAPVAVAAPVAPVAVAAPVAPVAVAAPVAPVAVAAPVAPVAVAAPVAPVAVAAPVAPVAVAAPVVPVAVAAPVAPVVSSDDRQLRSSSFCNHQFTDEQDRLQPIFSETEADSIITGTSTRAVLRSLAVSVPNNGVGSTKWDLKWNYDYGNVRGQGCSIRNATTQVSVHYQLPLWPDQLRSTDRNLTDQWKQYSDSLRPHHCEHGKLGIDASIEVKRRLLALEPRNDCGQLEVDADNLVKSIVAIFKERESRLATIVVTDYIRDN